MRNQTVKQIAPTLSGVFAALPTPYEPDGSPAIEALYPILDFLLGKRLPGLCIGGATGEYAACSIEERTLLFQTVAKRVDGRANLILGVGGEHSGHVLRLARAAADCGAIAVLLPPPSFLPFDAGDLLNFLRQVGSELPLPVLLYNIPQFTRELGMHNILHLIESVPNILGVKDSSGLHLNLSLIQRAKARTPMVFFIGSDELLLEAFEHGANGAISGTASACPELILGVYEASRSGKKEKARALQSLLEEFLTRIRVFPSPWAIKLALQARGIETGSLGWPMGKRLCLKREEFQEWFSGWIAACEPVVASAAT